ncbi:hypothetical protein SUDANB180_06188 [Streptomyces sp. enrichment culture]
MYVSFGSPVNSKKPPGVVVNVPTEAPAEFLAVTVSPSGNPLPDIAIRPPANGDAVHVMSFRAGAASVDEVAMEIPPASTAPTMAVAAICFFISRPHP